MIINFKACIAGINEQQKITDRTTRHAVMKAQDGISARIQTFPVANIEKLDDIEISIPKLICFNKQMYEILFALLQTHPCYLINWLCASIRKEVDLFDDHPQAFLDNDEDVQLINGAQNKLLSIPEHLVQSDEQCYLLAAIFGGLKNIRNDHRIINCLMVIGIRVFEFELEEACAASPNMDYDLDAILSPLAGCTFAKIYRLVYHSQTVNTDFAE